ncbi:MAG: hypothetical protein AAF744_11080 [Pseudomonadota bacterium]
MAKRTASETPKTPAQKREDRLKSALKANMARRKAQARSRAEQDEGASPDKKGS